MKVFLDDRKKAPEGWIRVFWPCDVIDLITTGEVTEISLDHDLGDKDAADKEGRKEITGYDVLLWIEEQVCIGKLVPPKIKIHTDNMGVKKRMLDAVEAIERCYWDFGG